MTEYIIHRDETNGRVGERTETVTADTTEITDSGVLALYDEPSGGNITLADMNDAELVAAFSEWNSVTVVKE